MTQREPINETPPTATPLVNPAAVPASPLPRRVVRRRGGSNQGSLRPSRLNLALTHLLLIVFCILFAFPIYWIIRISLQSGSALLSVDFSLLPQNPTLDNYVRVFTNPVLGRAFLNSVIFAGGTTLVSLVLAISAAYAYSRMRFRGRNFSLWAMILLQAVPGIATIVPLYVLFVQFNLINTYHGLIIAYTAGTLPFSIWMMKSYFDTIPREIDEAAQVDGATFNQSFLRVILPLALPAIAIVALFGFITGWTEFVLAITFITSGDLYPLSVRLYSIVGERTTEWGYFAAMSLVFAAPVVLFFLIFQRFLVGGLTLGSVKG
ncbi:MAG: carbohydrate ABC transporter permease [Chloroflexaceae bacterium]|jgi:arabinogalactan oligomer/maltooligosaccharide transport system permease protein|nr:carbohydrate ABC transporter permease [Chloroflexaceae bacterium]